jgi:hypothetical protein
MALDPEEFITLTDHGSMKVRAAVLRAMTLQGTQADNNRPRG